MLLKILFGFVVAVAIVVVLIFMQPPTYHLSRAATIAAPPAVVYSQISDFHNWNAWSPWAKLDPNMKQTFEGAASGAGARYTWSGNDQAGAGSMTIAEAVPGEKVLIGLAFLKPFPSTSNITFKIRPDAGGSAVEWAMDGDSTFASKAIQLFSSMDKMVGPDFEKGLAQLKQVAEESARKQIPPAPAQ